MSPVTRGFHRKRQQVDPSRVPPGQYVTGDFPVLSTGQTPHKALAKWTFCGTCGAVSQNAELTVYLRGFGTVIRCRSCQALLMAFTRIRGVTCVDLAGLASLSAAPD